MNLDSKSHCIFGKPATRKLMMLFFIAKSNIKYYLLYFTVHNIYARQLTTNGHGSGKKKFRAQINYIKLNLQISHGLQQNDPPEATR